MKHTEVTIIKSLSVTKTVSKIVNDIVSYLSIRLASYTQLLSDMLKHKGNIKESLCHFIVHKTFPLKSVKQ